MNENQLVLFDGVCNLCNGACSVIIKRDKKKQFILLLARGKPARAFT